MACRACHEKHGILQCSTCEWTHYCGARCADADWQRHFIEDHACEERLAPATRVLEPERPGHGALYVGGINAMLKLDALGIDAVVSVLHRMHPDEEAVLRTLIAPEKRPWKRYFFYDDPAEPISDAFEESAAWIAQQLAAGRNVLVHCWAGVSRSVTLVLYYMITRRGFADADAALRAVRALRPQANPNDGFMNQLKNRHQ